MTAETPPPCNPLTAEEIAKDIWHAVELARDAIAKARGQK